MRITIIHGQNHKGSSYHVGRILAEKLASEQEITEFFLPKDLNHFCLGCCTCLTDETKCPFFDEKKWIADAMEQVPQQKREQIEKDMTALAEKVKKARAGKPSLLIRFLFRLMASAKKSSKAGNYDAEEARYWRENGWLDGKRPWR